MQPCVQQFAANSFVPRHSLQRLMQVSHYCLDGLPAASTNSHTSLYKKANPLLPKFIHTHVCWRCSFFRTNMFVIVYVLFVFLLLVCNVTKSSAIHFWLVPSLTKTLKNHQAKLQTTPYTYIHTYTSIRSSIRRSLLLLFLAMISHAGCGYKYSSESHSSLCS